jgi:hypothetical protein
MNDKVLHDMKKLAEWKKRILNDLREWSESVDRLFMDLTEEEKNGLDTSNSNS